MGIRMPEELKRELEENGYDSEAIRTLLEEDLKKKKMKKAIEELKRYRANLPRLKGDNAIEIIRESRDSR
jgi:Arc/MetJ-type ribon-helix-helix transcriptional regulator